MTDLEIYTHVYEHPSGKEYQLAIVRDRNNKQGPGYVIRNWGKTVDGPLNVGQIQAQFWGDYSAVCDDFNGEDLKRSKRGYERALHREIKWQLLSPAQDYNLSTRSSYDFTNIDARYAGQGAVATGAPAAPKSAKDPDEVPGPRTGGAKRLEWVMAHPDHPQAFDQMMQVASQMATERDKAATTVAAIENDLAFVNAWLHQQMVQQIVSQG